MIRDGHIGHREAIAMLVSAVTTKIFLSYPQEMVRLGMSAGWQIPLLSAVWTTVLLVLFLRLYDLAENQNVIQVGFRVGGRPFGVFVALFYSLYFFILASLVLREFTETVVATVLPGTPVSAVAVPFMVAILYIAYRGSEVITRVALLFVPVVFIGVAIIFLLNLNWADPYNLFPIEGPGADSVIRESFLRISSYSEFFIIGLLFSFFRTKTEFKKMCIWSLVLSTVCLTITVVFYLMLFPDETSSRLPFPMYQISRMIYLSRFLQRIESVFIFIWVGSAVLNVGISLWAATYSLAEGLQLPMYKPLLAPMSILIYACSFIPRNYPEAASWDINIFRKWVGLVVFGFTLLLFLIVTRRNRRRRKA
jgi:spore germination protein KB